jgi:hypothetical protein
MYEAEDLGDANDAALSHSGLGERDASSRVKDKIRKMNMPLEKRFQMEEEEEGVQPVLKVTNKGGAKELTYVPIAARKKREAEKKKRDDESSERGGRSKGQRRGVKDLGFKTPFKNR